MTDRRVKIGVVAPGGRIDPALADQLLALAARLYGPQAPEIRVHAQCFLTDGHFAGDDAVRTAAFVEMANDPGLDAIWFARGGYGACRLLETALPLLGDVARAKTYLGYSDAGSLLGALYGLATSGTDDGPFNGCPG